MKYKEYFCFYILFIMILFSCTSKTHLKKIVSTWTNKEIIFPSALDSLNQDSLWKSMIKNEYKVLIYVDTNSCTECRLKLYEWHKIIQEVDSNNNVSFIFTIYTKDYPLVDFLKKKNRFNYPIFYDYTNKIGKLNKFPKDPRFQTFLLDQNNRVILIGNPIGNKHLWNLYKQTIMNK